MSQFLSGIKGAVELDEVRVTESITVHGLASDTKFTKNMKQTGLQIFYCGAFVLFARDGSAAHAVPIHFVKQMVALEDAEAIRADAAKLKKVADAAASQARDLKLLEEQAKAEAYRLEKESILKAKAERDARMAAGAEDDAKADIASTPIASAPPIPPPAKVEELLADMKHERGTMSDEEARSMKAAVARAKQRRR